MDSASGLDLTLWKRFLARDEFALSMSSLRSCDVSDGLRSPLAPEHHAVLLL